MPAKRLVANHQHILRALQDAKGTMTAYEILDAVHRYGINAPSTVYRALTRLIDQGLVHRLESINAYLACKEIHAHRGPAVVTICRDCGQVDELPEDASIQELQEKAARLGFLVKSATVELKGRCASCRGE
jgi:Fur family transcriptional regulator, zinc uptake regulator